MDKAAKVFKEYPFLFVTILVSIVSIIFFVYLPFQINLFPDSEVKKLYYVDNISDAHLKIIQKFNEKYKGEIEVIPVNLPFYNFTTNDRKAILTRSLRSRSDGIDIFAVDLIWIKRFAKWGYKMDNHFSQSSLQNINPMALEACYQNNNLVAFPLFLDLSVLYYRKDLIHNLKNGEEIEKKIQNSLTWDEFISVGKQYQSSITAKSSGKNPFYIFTGGEGEGMICCFHEMFSKEEGNDLFTSSKIDLKGKPAHRNLQLLKDFIHKYNFTPKDVTKFDEYNSCLYAIANNSVFFQGWAGFHKQSRDFLLDTLLTENIKIAPLPHFKGHTTSSVFGGWSLMISQFSNRKEEALKFINFLFEKESQEILYEIGGYLPINMEVYRDSTFLKKHKELADIQKLLVWGKHRPFLENYTRISEIMARMFRKALKNEISVEDALSSASAQINSEKITE